MAISYEKGLIIGRSPTNGAQLFSEDLQNCAFEILYERHNKIQNGKAQVDIHSLRLGLALYNLTNSIKTVFIPQILTDLDKWLQFLEKKHIPLCDFDSYTEKLHCERRSSNILTMQIRLKKDRTKKPYFAKIYKHPAMKLPKKGSK